MGATRIAVVLTTYWLTGVVGAASLSPGDQYSPYQSSHGRDVAQVPLNYPNWLKYRQELTTRLESTDSTSERRRDDNYIPSDYKSRKDSAIRELDVLPVFTGEWKVSSPAKDNRYFSDSGYLGVSEDSESSLAARNDDFVRDDTFQDQGPGSVEVYKLDLHHESSLLVPQVDGRLAGSRMKSKLPKKATAEEILWKLKSVDNNENPLPAIFQQPPKFNKESTSTHRKINENHKDEVFTVGGVPELQVGCEGLEASDRRKRSENAGVKNANVGDWDDTEKYREPVYRESTEPILLRVTPIVLDLDEEAPPSGEVYEEMDELLKLKKMESTSPEPTTRRWNRGDIDPVLEMNKRQEEHPMMETFPERGDLGPSNTTDGEGKRVAEPEAAKIERFRRDTSSFSTTSDSEDESAIPESSAKQTGNSNGRKLLWARYSDGRSHHGTESRYDPGANGPRDDEDLWGFGENDGDEDESDTDQLREAELAKRRREYEQRRQEMNRDLATMGDRNRHPENAHHRDVNAEIEKIRLEYEKQLEIQERERRRMEIRRKQEESRRRLEEEQRRREWTRRREEERRIHESHRNYEEPPSSLTRPESRRDKDAGRSHRGKEDEESKLRDYIERNRPIDPKQTKLHPTPDGSSGKNESEHRRWIEDQRNRQMEEERRRQRVEDERRRQRVEEERRRQRIEEERRHREKEEERKRQRMEEERKRQQMEEERKRQQMNEYQRRLTEEHHRRRMEETRKSKADEERRQRERDEEERRRQAEDQRRRNHSRSIEEEERRRLEEERKLQDYVRRNQPVLVPRQNHSRTWNQESGLQEQRRTIEAARLGNRNNQPIMRYDHGRVHGPSAPTNFGHRNRQDDSEYRQRHQERLEEKRQWEMNQRRVQEEERRREVEYQRAESRRRELNRLAEIARRDEENRRKEPRRNGSQDYGSSRRPSGEIPDREAEELRRRESAGRTADNALRNQQDQERTRSEVRARQRLREERERQRFENERNSRNSRRRRPHHEDHSSRSKPGQRGEGVRGGYDPIEWRRREHARLNSLPVNARIILRPDSTRRIAGETPPVPTSSTSSEPFKPLIGSRSNFDNDIDFPAISPNRTGMAALRFPAPPTPRPPAQSPGACVWAIVQCCPANSRLTSCFESMGCPGANWDSNPCRGSLADAARDEILKFYQTAEPKNTRF